MLVRLGQIDPQTVRTFLEAHRALQVCVDASRPGYLESGRYACQHDPATTGRLLVEVRSLKDLRQVWTYVVLSGTPVVTTQKLPVEFPTVQPSVIAGQADTEEELREWARKSIEVAE